MENYTVIKTLWTLQVIPDITITFLKLTFPKAYIFFKEYSLSIFASA